MEGIERNARIFNEIAGAIMSVKKENEYLEEILVLQNKVEKLERKVKIRIKVNGILTYIMMMFAVALPILTIGAIIYIALPTLMVSIGILKTNVGNIQPIYYMLVFWAFVFINQLKIELGWNRKL